MTAKSANERKQKERELAKKRGWLRRDYQATIKEHCILKKTLEDLRK